MMARCVAATRAHAPEAMTVPLAVMAVPLESVATTGLSWRSGRQYGAASAASSEAGAYRQGRARRAGCERRAVCAVLTAFLDVAAAVARSVKTKDGSEGWVAEKGNAEKKAVGGVGEEKTVE